MPATKNSTPAAKAKVVRRPRKTSTDPAPAPAKAVTVPDENDTAAVGGNAIALASIPPMSVANSYIHRVLPGGKSDFEVFDFAHKAGLALLIEGPTGPGKTMATRAWAATNGKMLARVPCNIGVEPSQLFGKYVPTESGGFKWVDGPVTHVVRNGGVILINEVNFMPDRVATVLFGLLDANREIVLLDHEGEVVKAHPDLLIVADMNPDYEGTRPLNKAFRNRYGLQITWDYDPNVESTLLSSKSLLAMAQQLRAEAAKGAFETPVSTNMLMEFERVAKGLGLDFAFSNFVNHFLAEERSAVELVCRTHKANIEADYKAPEPEADADDDDDDSTPAVVRDSKYDPEWDVYGIDWVYADEADL